MRGRGGEPSHSRPRRWTQLELLGPSRPNIAPPRIRGHNLYRLITVREMDKKVAEDQGNTAWKWIIGLGHIPSTDPEYLELAALAAAIYIANHVPAELLGLNKWWPRLKDKVQQLRKLLVKRLTPLYTHYKPALLIMAVMRDGFWNGVLIINCELPGRRRRRSRPGR
jgi:hypothetical protein